MNSFSAISELKGDVAVVILSGRVDSATAPQLDSSLSKVIHENKKVVIKITDVEYMSSAGVRAIVKTMQSAQKSGGGVKLANISKPVREVLETVGMLDLMQVYPTVDEAVASF